jgi:hypothetical protein
MIGREPGRDHVENFGTPLQNCPAGAERPGPQEAELSDALPPSFGAQDYRQDRDQEDREECCHWGHHARHCPVDAG